MPVKPLLSQNVKSKELSPVSVTVSFWVVCPQVTDTVCGTVLVAVMAVASAPIWL